MSRRYYQDSRSPSAVFVPMPVDRGVLGEKKVEALQRQIERLENDQMKRKELIEKLSKNKDKNQREHQEKLLVSCDTRMLCKSQCLNICRFFYKKKIFFVLLFKITNLLFIYWYMYNKLRQQLGVNIYFYLINRNI